MNFLHLPFYTAPGRMIYSLLQARFFGEASLAKVEPVITNHARGVYIIKTEFCISPTQRVVYHQVADEYTLKRDEIHLR